MIAVSACLAGRACRYDGKANTVQALKVMVERGEAVPICPEVLGGLPVPRPSCEIVNGTVRTQTGESKERPYQEGARRALAIVEERRAELVILQPRSPSCGLTHIYDGTFSGVLIEGSGRFAQALQQRKIPAMDMENLTEIRRLLKKR